MTPAELIAWAARIDEQATGQENDLLSEPGWPSSLVEYWQQDISDMRLAARLARFAAERGGLEEEK